MKRMKLGEILVSEGLITEEQLREALDRQRTVKKKLGQILVDMHILVESDMLMVLAKKLDTDYSEQPLNLVEPGVKDLVTEEFARRHTILPLYIRDGTLHIATNDPLDFVTIDDLSTITELNVMPIVSPRSKIEQGISSLYSYTEQATQREKSKADAVDEEIASRVDSAPIVKMVNTMVTNAYQLNASDIHIEPQEAHTRIRYRIDGTLSEQMVIRKELHELVTTRIKIIAGMDIAEKRIPQDGSFRINTELTNLDIRVSSIPTPLGEKVVLRLLGADRSITYDLSQIELAEDIKEKLRKIAQIPNGILLLTGPTGSGKTTTLYSLLNEVATVQQSVVTIEDPVEKQFEGITQVQINTRAGLTFASGLRSILRQDPDVIMIGEIRDAETAAIAIRAAITGHFVLSTLHTNDALSAVTRLMDMGVEHYLVASSVKAVLAQRLVRKICPYCSHDLHTTMEERVLLNAPNLLVVSEGTGCERCNNSGYLGRMAIFEIVIIDETLQQLITTRAPMQELVAYCKAKGTVFLKQDVVRLIREKKTTIKEARRILFSFDL